MTYPLPKGADEWQANAVWFLPEDVLWTIKVIEPENGADLEVAAEFLRNNVKHIVSAMTEAGQQAIEDLLFMDEVLGR